MVTWIRKEDFGKRCEHHSYKIRCPGTYRLKQNVSFHPFKNGVAAIEICSSDVVLDLNSKTLKQCGHSDKSQTDGIAVSPGHRNVTIKGYSSSIRNFSRRGIYVAGDNSEITLKGVTVSGCGYGTEKALVETVNGVESGVPQSGLQLGDMEFLQALGIGIYNGGLTNLTVSDVSSIQNNIGCALGEGSNYRFDNCNFSENLETRLVWEKVANLGGFYQPVSVVCYGLVYFSNPDATPGPNIGITDVEFKNSRFNQNKADAGDIVAQGSYCDAFIMAVNFRGLKISNCQFNSNESVLPLQGIFNQTRGLVLGSGAGTVVQNSEFLGNKGGSIVNGFNLSGLIASTSSITRNNFPAESVTIRDCVSSGNLATTDVTLLDSIESIGYSIRYPSGVTMERCVAEDNRSVLTLQNRDRVSGFADGIFIFSDPTFPLTFSNNISVRDCKLSRNRVVNGVNGTSSGLRVFDDLCENVVIQGCVVTDNRPDVDELPNPPTFFTTGIDLFNAREITGNSYTMVTDNVIQRNGGAGVDNNLQLTNITDNQISFQEVGVFIREGSNCNTVTDNKFTQNFFSVVDQNAVSTTLVAGNKGYDNAVGYSVNYQGGQPVPVAVSSLPDFPLTPSVAYSNIEIQNPACPFVSTQTQPPTQITTQQKLKIMSKRLSLTKKI